MKKIKILAALIILAILINIMLPVISNVQAQEPASITVANSEEGKEILVAPGDTFTIKVKYKSSEQRASSLAGALLFDDSKLEIVNKVELSEGLYNITDKGALGSLNYVSWDSTDQTNAIFYLFQNDTENLKTGDAFQVTFRVKEGATGIFDFSFYNIKHLENGYAESPVSVPITIGDKLTGRIKTPLQSISLSQKELVVGVQETKKLTVEYNPTNTTDSKKVTWSSDNSNIAKVDENGNVKGIAPGNAVITADCNGKKDTCKVTVTSKLQSITLDKTTLEMSKEQNVKLNVIYNPSNTTDSKEVTWESSNKEVATVDENGNVTAHKIGKATITVTSSVAGIKSAKCEINVTSKLQSIYFDEEQENIEINKGNEVTLKVNYLPEDTTDGKTVKWESSDSTIAKVDNNGKITALKPGVVTIIANCNGKIATATINVKSPLTGIEIVGGDRELLPGQKENLSVSYKPEDTTDSKTISWKVDNSNIVSIDAKGTITANKPGTAIVTAKCGEFTSEIKVTVPEIHTEKIAFENEKVTLTKNESMNAKILYYPDNTTDDRTVTWSSEDETVATVDNNGKITAIGGGTTRIKAQVGEKEAYCEVNVVIPLTGIKLNAETLQINKGNSSNLEVIYNEEDTTDDKTVTWTSLNETVATVDENGKVTAVGVGTAIIKAQVGNYVVTCTVNVKVPLIGISIKSDISLLKNQSQILTVTYIPEDTIDDRTVTWSSEDETVATVDKDGKVTGLKEGKTTIIAKVGKFEAKCNVEVKEIKLEGIAINNKIDTLLKGQEAQLDVIYTPENTTDDKVVTWTSSDESVAIVDENGKVTALKEGKTTITVTSGEFKDSYKLEVKEIPITGMEINVDSTTMEEGEELQLNVAFTPENTTDSKNLIYVSSDESVVTVDKNGKLTAIKPGTAIITVVAENGLKTQVKLTVEDTKILENNESQGQENKEDKEDNIVASPKTGDINIALYSIMMITSLAGIVTILKKIKR